jgi:hypothetical protein
MRKAQIQVKEVPAVELWEDDVLIETRHFPDKSMAYIQDCADNWESGMIVIPINTDATQN